MQYARAGIRGKTEKLFLFFLSDSWADASAGRVFLSCTLRSDHARLRENGSLG